MAQNIPVPAEVVRQMAIAAAPKIHDYRERELYFCAEALQENVSAALSAVEKKDGEFVSIDASVVSSLAADSVKDAPQYNDAAEVFLKQYDIWR